MHTQPTWCGQTLCHSSKSPCLPLLSNLDPFSFLHTSILHPFCSRSHFLLTLLPALVSLSFSGCPRYLSGCNFFTLGIFYPFIISGLMLSLDWSMCINPVSSTRQKNSWTRVFLHWFVLLYIVCSIPRQLWEWHSWKALQLAKPQLARSKSQRKQEVKAKKQYKWH